jgi:hypothetical protein
MSSTPIKTSKHNQPAFRKLPPFIGGWRLQVAKPDRKCRHHQNFLFTGSFEECQAKHLEEKEINEVLENEGDRCFACDCEFSINQVELGGSNAQSIGEFRLQMHQEFVQGSAIEAGLFSHAVCIAADIEQRPGGDVESPIHDALNWRYTRFANQAKSTVFAALMQQETGECWQAKLSKPRKDGKGKLQKYETPVGNGSRAFLPAIPTEIRHYISHRYDVQVPLTGSFWDWLEQHPEIGIVFTEGGKKALSLLSLGYVAIALYGVNGGYRNVAEVRSLTADVQRFASPDRHVALAFDQDADSKTRSRVNAALFQFSRLLEQSGCNVTIASWNGQNGKGIDDLIVNHGAEAASAAIAESLPLDHWQIWQRLENRLTYPASIKLKTADLSTLEIDRLPQTGVIALDSAKGTGKTKFIAATVSTEGKVLAGCHRIALSRNLCERIGLDYRGDLDKVNGRFISGSGYSLRIGFVVDSLLAIEPEIFAGCDLILDEVVQVVRHLLTSSTCAKDGKRPALLARLRQLIQSARRVIVADADLDNATLHYIRELRGDNTPVFLIRNDYQPQGYAVQWIESPDRSAIVSQLCREVDELPEGKTVFVVTDSKALSKSLTRMLGEQHVLLLNSQTSGGEEEREFIADPDSVLSSDSRPKAVVCSPSLATGVSIEAQSVISRVYGIFMGSSLNDADIAQSLMRVREPVDRVVWCAKRGNNFSKISRSTSHLEIKNHLQQRTSVAVSLVRSGLREDTIGAIEAIDWQSDPHINLYCRIAAEQNRSMYNLKTALMVRLRHEGHTITIDERGQDKAIQQALISTADDIKHFDAEELQAADDLTYGEVAILEAKEGLTPEERLAIAKFHLKDFYCLDELTIEDVLADEGGRRRGELLSLEAQLHPGLALDRTARALEKQMTWNSGNCPWDISGAELRRAVREKIGLNDFLTLDRDGWTKYDLKSYADRARHWGAQIKLLLNLSIKPVMSDVQIIHQLLSQMGISITGKWSRLHPGHEGEKLKVYSLDAKAWQPAIDTLERRKARRERLEVDRGGAAVLDHPPRKWITKGGGDPSTQKSQTCVAVGSTAASEAVDEDSIADVTNWLTSAVELEDRSYWEIAKAVITELGDSFKRQLWQRLDRSLREAVYRFEGAIA